MFQLKKKTMDSSVSAQLIRKANTRDASRIAEIFIFSKRCAFRDIFKNDFTAFNDLQVLDLALYYKETSGALDDVYVYDDGIVKGVMTWERSGEKQGFRELKELYIEPFFQKQGVGKALLMNFIDVAIHDGISTVILWVMEENIKARNFYEHFGFICTNEKKIIAGTDKYLIKYTKSIKS